MRAVQREYVLRTDNREDLFRWHTNLLTAAGSFRLGGGSVSAGGGGAEAAATPSAAGGGAVTISPKDVAAAATECMALMVVGVDETEVRRLLERTSDFCRERQTFAENRLCALSKGQ